MFYAQLIVMSTHEKRKVTMSESELLPVSQLGPCDRGIAPHPHHQALVKILEPRKWQLIKRLPVYSKYDDWLPGNLKNIVSKWRLKLSIDR